MLAPSSSLGGVVVLGSLAETTVLAALGGKTTSLAVLVDGVADPVDAGIAADSLVGGVDEDDLVVLVDTVTVDLVRVEDTQVSTTAANTLLSGSLQATLELEVVDTLANGLTVGGTLGGRLFAVSATDTDTVDAVTLLGLVPKTTGLVGAGWARSTVNDRELAVLPAADTGDEEHHIGLLLVVELRHISAGLAIVLMSRIVRYALEGTHCSLAWFSLFTGKHSGMLVARSTLSDTSTELSHVHSPSYTTITLSTSMHTWRCYTHTHCLPPSSEHAACDHRFRLTFDPRP